jgi:hypothetical protein
MADELREALRTLSYIEDAMRELGITVDLGQRIAVEITRDLLEEVEKAIS